MVVWSMFDGSGIMGLPWAEAGHDVYCFNADSGDHGEYSIRTQHENINYVSAWIDNGFNPTWDGIPVPDIIFAFPPCTDLAVSGAAHFDRKRQENPAFQEEAVTVCRVAQGLGDLFGVPYMIENPVSVLSSMWRKPDYTFNPYEYGGYLDPDDAHPFFPELIMPRDAYPKKTCLWCGNGFVMPEKRPVPVPPGYSMQHKALGGKSARTKMIRSLTPRGFARAVFGANGDYLCGCGVDESCDDCTPF